MTYSLGLFTSACMRMRNCTASWLSRETAWCIAVSPYLFFASMFAPCQRREISQAAGKHLEFVLFLFSVFLFPPYSLDERNHDALDFLAVGRADEAVQRRVFALPAQRVRIRIGTQKMLTN